MNTILLKDEDMKSKTHFPVIALLNEAYRTDIIGFMKALNQGVGSGYNYTTCSLWEELDDYDKANMTRFDGIMIETEIGEELCLSMKELFGYLVLLKSRIAPLNPQLADKMSVLLNEYKIVYKNTL